MLVNIRVETTEMQFFLALFVVGLCLWESCIAICPDGSVNNLVCSFSTQFQCPEGYTCIDQGENVGLCCLDPAYSCPRGFPIGYGSPVGLLRCNGRPCPFPFYCQAVEPTRTIPGVCCPRIF